MAHQLKLAPENAAHSVQQTFENVQHNYKLLGEYIQVRTVTLHGAAVLHFAAVAGTATRQFKNAAHHPPLTLAPQNKVPGSLQMQKLLGSAQAAAGAGGSKFTTSPRLRAPPSAARPTLTSRETITTDGAPEDERETAQQAVAAIKEAVGVLSEEEGSRSSTQVGLQMQHSWQSPLGSGRHLAAAVLVMYQTS